MQKIPDRFNLFDLLRRPKLLRDMARKTVQQTNLQYVLGTGEIRRARYGRRSTDGTVDLGDIVTAVSALPPPVVVVQSNTWSDLAVASGGCVTPVAIQIAEATHQAIAAESFASKILMLYPFLGCNAISSFVPLIDRLGKGLLVNHNFVDADFTQALGLQGDGSTKYLESRVIPSELGIVTTNTGGIGWVETNIAAADPVGNVEPIGAYKTDPIIPDNRFSMDLRPVLRGFRWGETPGGIASETEAAIDAHYYGQCEHTALRKFWLNGVKKAESTVLTDIRNDLAMLLMGCDRGVGGIGPWGGRGFCAYFTDGTLTDLEVAKLHLILTTYLLNPKITGVPIPYGGNPIEQEVYPDPDAPANAEPDDCEACLKRIVCAAAGGVVTSAEGEVVYTLPSE